MTVVIGIVYALCLIVAALNVPSMAVFLFYGLPTWLGGCLFTVLLNRALEVHRGPR